MSHVVVPVTGGLRAAAGVCGLFAALTECYHYPSDDSRTATQGGFVVTRSAPWFLTQLQEQPTARLAVVFGEGAGVLMGGVFGYVGPTPVLDADDPEFPEIPMFDEEIWRAERLVCSGIDLHDVRFAYPYHVATAPECRRQGVARSLYEWFIGEAREQGGHLVVVEVEAALSGGPIINQVSAEFHAACGFVDSGFRVEEPANGVAYAQLVHAAQGTIARDGERWHLRL